MVHLITTSVITFILNIPFGYWRANVKRFSWQWVLAIHIPVPFIIFMRIYTHVGFGWETYVFLVISFFLGQKMGTLLHKKMVNLVHISSCLFVDLMKLIPKN